MATKLPIPVPTMSTEGWVRDSQSKLDFLLAHFFAADYNQTYLYVTKAGAPDESKKIDQVSSMSRIIQLHSGNARGVIADLRTYLERYLNRYYLRVTLDVSALTDLDLDPRDQIDVLIRVEVTDVGGIYSFQRSVSTVQSKLQKIINLNNG